MFFEGNTYNRLRTNAFIVDEVVNACYSEGKFIFTSYANANRIFSLLEFFQEATNEELETFAELTTIIIDQDWLLKKANITLRKLITHTQKSGVLNTKLPRKVIKDAKDFDVEIVHNGGKLEFPKNISQCRSLFEYLNDQYYHGLVSGEKFRTNSKAEYKGKS